MAAALVRFLLGGVRLVAVVIGGGVALAATLGALAPHLADIWSANESTAAEIDLSQLALRSIVYDANGDEFDVLYDVENRAPASLDEISEEARTAVVVVEDEGFWDHNGVNASAVIRALIRNVNAGGIEQGGSTITQQLIKNGVVGDQRDLSRKVPEAALALRLEREMSKEEILERYLNTVYFGGGVYGIRAAAEQYFGTTPDRLDWGQSALLAGLISNPTRYDPTRFPDEARKRYRFALKRLLDTGHITEAEFEHYLDMPLPSRRNVAAEWQPTSYFIEEVRRRLLDDPRLGATRTERAEALFGGGLRIYTTYDPAAQAMAEEAIAANLPDDPRFFTAALAAVEPGTGKVRALVGGPGFDRFEFNIATQKGRPTGSSFKAYVLAAAMENGYVPADQVSGIGPCEFPNPAGYPDPYVAQNFGNSTGSVATIRSQTLRSSNCAFLRLGQIVGLSNVVDTAHALGVTSELDPGVISMPLGVFDITPLDMATAYASFANDGVHVDPIFIERVEDRDGNLVFENRPHAERAISVQSARLVTSVLEANVRGGTGTRARLPEQPAAGKTGTAQDFGDAWFVGYTPYLATAVWMGNPDERVPMRGVPGVGNVTGGSVPARIWGAFNTAYHASRPVVEFADPEPTRGGRRIRTDLEEKAYEKFLDSPCGDEDLEVDTDGDGVTDSCKDPTVEFNPEFGRCPALMEAVDLDGDGKFDQCQLPTTTTTTTTTTTVAPTSSGAPGSTTLPPSTTAPPSTSTSIPPPPSRP